MRQRNRQSGREQLVLHLIDDIYSAALDPSLWEGVIYRIVQAVNGATGQLVSPNESATTSLWVPYGFGRETMDAYAQNYYKMDLWTQSADALHLPSCTVVTGEELVETSTFMKSEFYNDFLKHNNFQRIVACFVDNGESGNIPKTSLSVYRPPGSEPFGREAVELLGKITPHVRRAISLHWRLHDLEHNLAANIEILEHLMEGVALIDETIRVTYLNRAGQDIVNSNDGLSIKGGKLVAVPAEKNAEIVQLLTEATRTSSGLNDQLGSVVVGRAAVGGSYLVTAIPMPAQNAITVGRRHASAIIFISKQPLNAKTGVSLVARTYVLTPAESRLLAALVQGRPLKGIAAMLGISANTAHTHLNNIFRKTGTHKQTDLVRLAMSFAHSFHSETGSQPESSERTRI